MADDPLIAEGEAYPVHAPPPDDWLQPTRRISRVVLPQRRVQLRPRIAAIAAASQAVSRTDANAIARAAGSRGARGVRTLHP